MLIVNGSSGNDLKILGDHMHSALKVYPSLASAVTITGPAVATNAYGAGVDVIATNVVTAPFDIHFIAVEEMSTYDKWYQIRLSKTATAATNIIAECRVVGGADKKSVIAPIITPRISSNCAIVAEVACQSSGQTLAISVGYHTY